MSTVAFAAILLAMVTWVGALIFLSFLMAPTAFSVLDQKDASRFVRAIFPRYYGLGVGCGVFALLGLVGLGGVSSAWTGPLLLEIAIIVVMTCLTIYSLTLVPRINAARDAGQAQDDRFKRLHKRSVVLNAIVLFLGLGALVILAHSMMRLA